MNFSIELFGKELSFGKAKSISAGTSAFLSGQDLDSGGAELRNAYAQSAWIYIAISRLAEKISALPFVISDGKENGTKLKRRDLSDLRIESGEVVDLFNQPHSSMNRQLFWEMVITWSMLRGEFFVLPLDKEGKPVDLKASKPRVASMLTLDPAFFYHIIEGHELSAWRYTGSPLMSPVASEIVLPSEVIHSRSPNPYLYWRGLSPLAVASVSAGADFAAAKYNQGYWLNNADTGLVVTSPPGSGWPTKEQREEIAAALRERKRKAGTPDRPMFLGGGLTVEKPQLSGMESQFIENRKMNRQEILAIFKLSDSIIGFTDAKSSSLSGGGSSIDAEELKFVESTIKPLCSRLEAAMEPIVKSFGPNLVGWFDIESLPVMQESRMAKVETATKAFALGAAFNDINRIYDLGFPEYEYGKRNYLPFSLQDATEGLQPKEPTEPTEPEENPLAQMSRLLKRGGPGSGPRPGNGSKEKPDKSALSRASYNKMDKAKLKVSLEQEKIVADSLGGVNLPDNEPFDVIHGKHAVEVKTLVDGKQDKVTMRKECRERKEKWARKNGKSLHTVAADNRNPPTQYFYKKGVGSYRLTGMERITLSQLKDRIK